MSDEQPRPVPYRHPSVWRGPDLVRSDAWIVRLDGHDIAELEAAMHAAKGRALGIPELGRSAFELPTLGAKLRSVLYELEHGRGFVVVRGLPVERYSKGDAALIYWGIGTHLGRAVAQNAQGEVLGHVRNLGVDWPNDQRARGYQTRDHLPFHSDSTDVVGLLCLRTARRGGSSRIVSSTALYNEFVSRRPDLWRLMCEPFHFDRRSEEGGERKPYYVSPCFNFLDGRLFVLFNFLIEGAQRFPDVPRLSEGQREALALMTALCNDPDFYLDMELEPGDMQFLCNYEILHSRTAYEDWPEPQRKRHLLRLWLRTPGFARLPRGYADRNADVDAWLKNPSPPIFDNSEIVSELADRPLREVS